MSCIIPEPVVDIIGDDRWMSMHKRYVAETKNSEPDVVFIGDSIIQQLQFSSLWTDKINSLHSLNFGIGGDKVQNVLWRLQNGEMNFHVKVKAVVLFVGTNNVDDTPEDILAGIIECVRVISAKLEDVHVILPGEFPNKHREKNNVVNDLMIGLFSDYKNVHVVPIHENILQPDGTLSHYMMHDYLHLTNAAYTKIFGPVYEKLCALIQK